LELLEDQLSSYAGTVLLVSHDRAFLNDVVTSVLVFEKHPADRADTWLAENEGWYVNEYVGGYDEWAARRVLPPEPEPEKKAPPPPRPKSAKKKLSDWERRELDDLPGKIEALEAEQAQWHTRLADPAFYRQPGPEITAAKQRAEALIVELEAAYHRWETLESRAAQ
jgi:ATP-binding cassette subfamily F protein uup